MVFDFFKRKKQPPAPKRNDDPIAAYDGMIETVERQAAEVRKSAATLLALRGELTRDRARYQVRIDELNRRLQTAQDEGQPKAERTFRLDLSDAQQLAEKTDEALATSEANAKLLMQAAEELAQEAAALKAERVSARARFSAGVTVSAALQARVAQFDQVMKLDAARDEVERANALAELYREDAGPSE